MRDEGPNVMSLITLEINQELVKNQNRIEDLLLILVPSVVLSSELVIMANFSTYTFPLTCD